MSRGELAKGLAGPPTSVEALRRCRVGGTTPKVDFRLMALTETVESLSQTAKDLAEMRSTEWMTAEQAAKHLGCGSAKAFEKIAEREGIPKHYLSPRAPATTALSSTSGLRGAAPRHLDNGPCKRRASD